jgi:hypothetical protein
MLFFSKQEGYEQKDERVKDVKNGMELNKHTVVGFVNCQYEDG